MGRSAIENSRDVQFNFVDLLRFFDEVGSRSIPDPIEMPPYRVLCIDVSE